MDQNYTIEKRSMCILSILLVALGLCLLKCYYFELSLVTEALCAIKINKKIQSVSGEWGQGRNNTLCFTYAKHSLRKLMQSFTQLVSITGWWKVFKIRCSALNKWAVPWYLSFSTFSPQGSDLHLSVINKEMCKTNWLLLL